MTVRNLLVAGLAGGLALIAALLAFAVAAPRADACALSPMSDCGIVGSKVNPVIRDTEERAGCPELDCGPTNPYCDIYAPQPGRVCTTVKEDFVYQAVDTSDAATGDNRCVVTLEGAAPEDQNDPYNRPDVQYKTSIKCQKSLQVISIKPALYEKGSSTPISSANEILCHPSMGACGLSYSTANRGLLDGNKVYTQRAYVKLILPGGPDPWVAAMGQPANGPGSCAPGNQNGYVVECLVEIDIPTTPPA